MVNYNCKRCLKIFKQKSHYERHVNRKYKCTPHTTKITNYSVFCNRCNKGFSYSSGLVRHLQRKNKCQLVENNNNFIKQTEKCIEVFKNKITEQNQILKEKEEEIKKLKEQLSNKPQLKTQSDVNQQKTKVNYGEENTDYISDLKIIKCLITGIDGDIELFRDIYFDPEHPENRTIEIKKGNKIIFMRHINGKWIQTEEDKISRDFLSKSRKLFHKTLDYKSKNKIDITEAEVNHYDKKLIWDATYETEIKKGICDIVVANTNTD